MGGQSATFGELLQRYRVRAALSQEELAERAGLSASAISALERGARQRPYPHTRQLLAQALGLSPDEAAVFTGLAPARPAAPSAGSGNLPARRAPLYGREQAGVELAELVRQDAGRLVTLTGVGGSGKTSLALAVAAQVAPSFAGGAWLVELAPLADADLLLPALAASLGLRETAAPAIDAVLARLKRQPLLLLLDNCEHLIDACAELAELFLARCPTLRILATSREPLQLAGERQWRVPPLAAPMLGVASPPAELAAYPAVQLFLARAQAAVPGFELNAGNGDAVGQICARLAGLPLAVELAAARVRVLAPGQILARLDDAIQLLTGGSRLAPTRQQTLRAALAWSYDLLTLAEQHVFARLAVMTGDCDLEAAEAVCREPDLPAGSVLDLLTRLVDKSLLLAEAGVTSARYRLLEPVRQYALRLLEADGTLEQVRERHAAYFLALAEQAAGELRGPEQIAWLDRLESEHDNLRAALLWSLADGDRVLGLRLAVALGPFWGVRGRLREGRDWLDRLLNAAGAGELPERLRVRALLADGRLAQWQGDFEAADSLLATCIELAHQLGEPLIAAEALVHLGAVYRRRGDPEDSARLLDESLHAFRAAGDEGGIALALMTLGVTLRSLGETARSTELLEESLARFQQLGDLRWIATTQTMLGSSLLKQGKLTGAARSFVAGLAAHQAIGDLTFSVFALHGLGAALARLAALEPATQVYGVMLALCDRVGLTLDPVSQRDYDSVAAGLRAQLGAADFDRLLAEGRTLSPDQVLDGVSRVLGDLSAE